MGFRRGYACPGCNYKVITSAGPDRGRKFSTNTFVCKECKVIVDKALAQSTDTPTPSYLDGLNEFIMGVMEEHDGVKPNNNKDNTFKTKPVKTPKGRKKQGENICLECESTELELWDYKNMPCPKCGAKLIPDPDGIRMDWD